MRIRRSRAIKEQVQASAEYLRAVYLLRRLGWMMFGGSFAVGALLVWIAPSFALWTGQESQAVLLPWMMWCLVGWGTSGLMSVLCSVYVQKLRWWAWAMAAVLAHLWIVSGVLLVPGVLLRRALFNENLELASMLGSVESSG